MLWDIVKILFLFLFMNSCLIGQGIVRYNAEADALFRQAILQYESGKFVEARSLFNNCIYDYPFHHKTTASYIMLAKSEYNLKKYEDALITINELKHEFPFSSYSSEEDYISALSLYKLNQPDTALFLLFRAYNNSNAHDDDDRFIEPIMEVAKKSNRSINYYVSMFQGNKIVTFAKKLGIYKRQENIEQSDLQTTNIVVPDMTVNLREDKSEPKNNIVEKEYKIAIFTVPSNMQNNILRNELENEFVQAFNFCIDEFKKTSRTNMSLKYISSKQDSQSLTDEIESVAIDTNIIAILGPIYSEQFEIASYIASRKRIPIISPTANANGLSKISEYVFQVNPDFNNRAKSLAIYATKKMNMRNIALFAPNNSYGKNLVEIFTLEIQKHGGVAIAQEFYGVDVISMQKSIQELIKSVYSKGREKFIYLQGELANQNLTKLYSSGISKRFIDSISTVKKYIHINEFFGKDAERKVKELQLNTFAKTNYEINDPVYSIDAIYIPINNKNDIKNIATLLLRYKVNAQLLGTGDYNHVNELNAHNNGMENLIFDSDSYFDKTTDNNFFKRFSDKTGREASSYSLFAYDALSVVLHAVKNGKTNREQLKKFLSELDFFQGIHSKITFKWDRVNSYLNILKYTNKQIIKIDEINVNSN